METIFVSIWKRFSVFCVKVWLFITKKIRREAPRKCWLSDISLWNLTTPPGAKRLDFWRFTYCYTSCCRRWFPYYGNIHSRGWFPYYGNIHSRWFPYYGDLKRAGLGPNKDDCWSSELFQAIIPPCFATKIFGRRPKKKEVFWMSWNVQKSGFRRLLRREIFGIWGLAIIPPLFRNTWKQGGILWLGIALIFSSSLKHLVGSSE